jgi:pyruvate dehydrogenase E2 component (dihydrolipoamide acetyltransferase)
MEAGTIVKWLKAEGEQVQKGEPLYELDTDKVTQEVEADASGVLLKIAVQEGEVPVGRTIAVIGEQGEDVSVDDGEPGAVEAGEPETGAEKPSRAPARDDERERGRDASTDDAAEQVTEIRDPSRSNGRVKASPLARRIARERGIDLSRLQGTGPEGRIVAEDVERAEAAPAAATAAALAQVGEIEEIPLTSIRKTIARRLTAAWQAPVFQLTVSADMRRANDLVARSRELNPDVRVTVTDLLAKVCAQALVRHRAVNVEFTEEALRIHPHANVGIAVAAPQGLVVPVVRGVERLSLVETAQARAEIVGRARAG